MDFEDAEKIIDKARTQPLKTITIVVVLGIIVLAIAYGKTFVSDKAKQHAGPSDSATQKPHVDANGAHIGVIGDNAHIEGGIHIGLTNEQMALLGNNQKVVDRLLKELDAKDLALEQRQVIIDQWVKKYKELEEQLSERSAENPLVAQARAKLSAGDLEGAEALLLQSMKQHQENIEKEKKSAASDAFQLAGIKQLQLDYKSAISYYKKAVELDPQNSLFLNEYGIILDELGEYEKAIEHFEKALATLETTLPPLHPYIKTTRNNLNLCDVKNFFSSIFDKFTRSIKLWQKND